MYRDYRGLKKLIKVIELSQKDHDVHPSDSESDIRMSVLLFSSIAEAGSSEVDPHADERSLESSSVKTLSVGPLSGLGFEDRISVSSVNLGGSFQACSFDTSSKSGLCRST